MIGLVVIPGNSLVNVTSKSEPSPDRTCPLTTKDPSTASYPCPSNCPSAAQLFTVISSRLSVWYSPSPIKQWPLHLPIIEEKGFLEVEVSAAGAG